MSTVSVQQQSSRAHLLTSENLRPGMAKADLRKAEAAPWRLQIGGAIQRAASLRGWSLKELSAAVDRDPRQVARWIAGAERPQLDVLFAVDEFRSSLIQAFAELAGQDVEVVTEIRVVRKRVSA